jgi:hypothetical protein
MTAVAHLGFESSRLGNLANDRGRDLRPVTVFFTLPIREDNIFTAI